MFVLCPIAFKQSDAGWISFAFLAANIAYEVLGSVLSNTALAVLRV